MSIVREPPEDKLRLSCPVAKHYQPSLTSSLKYLCQIFFFIPYSRPGIFTVTRENLLT